MDVLPFSYLIRDKALFFSRSKYFVSILGYLTIIFSTGCASYVEETQVVREAFRGGRYEQALTSLENSDLKKQGRNELLYWLERASILDRMKEREKSRAALLNADRIVDRLYTVSVTKTAATFFVNEAMSDYEGEDYEKVAIHTMLALSFIEERNLSGARVEAAKINSKLQEITQNYGEKYAGYSKDAFARYLSGIIFEAQNDPDDAIIDYRASLSWYATPSFQRFNAGGVPKNLVKALYRLAKKRRRDDIYAQLKQNYSSWTDEVDKDEARPTKTGEIIVIHEAGQIAIKRAQEFIIPIGGQIVRFSFPTIWPRPLSYSTSSGVIIDDQPINVADNTANMDAIAHQCLEDRRGRLLAKGAARLLIKGQLTEQAREKFGDLGGLIANAYSAITETADTRSWTLFPQAYYISRARVPAGEHTVKIQTNGRVGNIFKVAVKENDVLLYRDFTPW